MSDRIKRRQFITLLGGAGIVWPLAARAQQGERMRRIGVLMAATADDPEYQPRSRAFQQGLAVGWIDGRNVRVDTRWAGTNADDIRKHAMELAAFAPDAIVGGSGTTTVAPLLQATRTVPIVFGLAERTHHGSRYQPGHAYRQSLCRAASCRTSSSAISPLMPERAEEITKTMDRSGCSARLPAH